MSPPVAGTEASSGEPDSAANTGGGGDDDTLRDASAADMRCSVVAVAVVGGSECDARSSSRGGRGRRVDGMLDCGFDRCDSKEINGAECTHFGEPTEHNTNKSQTYSIVRFIRWEQKIYIRKK